jgi:MarR family transcriptional regulator, 2-MHQ and catechol-resistance regulon repressor
MSSDAPTTAGVASPPCGVDDPRIRTFGLLLEAHARLTSLLDADLRASDGITLQTFEVLLRISRADGGQVTMSELASAVSLTTGGVTRLADRLERDGLVERRSCPTDRRVVHLSLTPAGTATLAAALEHHLESLQRRVISRVDPDALGVVDAVLDELRQPQD